MHEHPMTYIVQIHCKYLTFEKFKNKKFLVETCIEKNLLSVQLFIADYTKK